MQFEVKNVSKSVNELIRAIGYRPTYLQNGAEVSIMRQIGRNDYPRFHAYMREIPLRQGFVGPMDRKSYQFSIHLDQKKPSYEGSHAHSGEYDGDLVEQEADRIRNLLTNGH